MAFSSKSFVEYVKKNNPNEPEFIQAVDEVMESMEGYLNEHPEYLENGLLERLVEPERTISFRVPWVNDKGEVKVNKGYRVQFNSALGPYKGGLRFHPTVNLSIMKFLGFEQTFKNSLTGLSLGGGKGGSNFDPSGKSDNEIMRFCQSFITELFRHIGANTDVPAGDIGVGGREVGYMFGQYKRLQNEFSGVLTGKGISFGGSLVRTEATGYGVVYILSEVMKYNKSTLKGKSVLVSGSGNVSLYTVEKLLALGALPVSVSDSGGTLYVKKGISKSLLEELKTLKFVNRGRLSEFSKKAGVTYLPKVNPWDLKADIAIPCATQNEISLDDAKKLVKNKVKYVIEGANMPTTKEAYDYLKENSVIFVPGKAANAGGVSVSGFEMAQNSQRMSFTFEEVDNLLKNTMKNIHDTMVKYGKSGKTIDYVKGANIGGFVKVASAMKSQGVV
jgi:glutamate dehydrogenase (NADP+)